MLLALTNKLFEGSVTQFTASGLLAELETPTTVNKSLSKKKIEKLGAQGLFKRFHAKQKQLGKSTKRIRTGVENGTFWTEIRSGVGEPGGTPLPRILRSAPPGHLTLRIPLVTWPVYTVN